MAVGNDEYSPSCVSDCSAQTVSAIGETSCANSTNLELAEINELYIDERGASIGVAKNPLSAYTEGSDNSAAFTTWKAAVDKTTASKVRYIEGTGELPQPTETTITLGKGKTATIGTRFVLTYTVSVVDAATEKFMRTLQACKGEYHFWFATDIKIYGAKNGIFASVEACYPTFTGGRSEAKKWTIQIGWNAKTIALSDPKPW